MKKTKIWITAAALSLMMSAPTFAAQWKSDQTGWWWEEDDGSYPTNDWKEINGGWYYFNESGYMAANGWIGNYYLGADGKMLTDTTTPDGYKVGADGAWIPDKTSSLPVAPYLSILSNPLFYSTPYNSGAHSYIDANANIDFELWGNNSNTVDHGDYYELKNQELYNYKVYDTEKEAKKSPLYGDYGSVQKHRSGKYIIPDANDRYETVTAYSGSLYMDKNVKVIFYGTTYTWEEYFSLPESVTYGYNGSFGGYVTQVDEKGYITRIYMTNAG